MENKKYEYSVAFSFLAKDENLANELNDLIQDRANTFLYSKQQERLVGTDGEKAFNKVFEERARLVVVLYRKEWGTTSWTRIEETAIKNRAYNEGYDFTIFIPLDKQKSVPKYLPKTQIWGDLERWGTKGAASVIEARINSLGGRLKEESPEDIATRIRHDQEFETNRKNLLDSAEGFEKARLESQNLFNKVEELKNDIEKKAEGFQLGFNKRDNYCVVFYQQFRIRFQWNTNSSYSLEGATLYFLFDSPKRAYVQPTVLSEEKYQFDINKSSNYGWIKDNIRGSFKTSKQLANYAIKELLKKINQERENKKSNKYF